MAGCHAVITIASNPHHVGTELTRIGPGHKGILPARPSRATQLRCHLSVRQTLPHFLDCRSSWLRMGHLQDQLVPWCEGGELPVRVDDLGERHRRHGGRPQLVADNPIQLVL